MDVSSEDKTSTEADTTRKRQRTSPDNNFGAQTEEESFQPKTQKQEKEMTVTQEDVQISNNLNHYINSATLDKDSEAVIVELGNQIRMLTTENSMMRVLLESKNRNNKELNLQLIQYKEKMKELEDRNEDLIAERNDLENKLLIKESASPRSLHESMFEAETADCKLQTATSDEDDNARIAKLRSHIGLLATANVTLSESMELKKRNNEKLNLQLIRYKEKMKELEDGMKDLIAERNDLENKLIFKEFLTPQSLEKNELPLETENQKLAERIEELEASLLTLEFAQNDAKVWEGRAIKYEKEKEKKENQYKKLNDAYQELKGIAEESEMTLIQWSLKLSENNSDRRKWEEEKIHLISQQEVLRRELGENNLAVTKQKEELERQVSELQDKLAKNQQHASGDVVDLKFQLEKAIVEVERMREAETRADTKLVDLEELLRKRTSELDINEKALILVKAVIDELNKSRPVGEDDVKPVHIFEEMREENEELRQKMEKLEVKSLEKNQLYTAIVETDNDSILEEQEESEV